jgi:ADP-ribose pyrophosphatase YjhB (NUDIX family)
MKYTAGIFIFNGKNEILLVHPTNASFTTWSIPKGIVEEHESPAEAVVRELLEETNVDLNQLKKVYFERGNDVKYASGKKTLIPFFTKVLVGLKEIDYKCNTLVDGKDFYENDAIQWFKIEDAAQRIHETQVKALNEFYYSPS